MSEFFEQMLLLAIILIVMVSIVAFSITIGMVLYEGLTRFSMEMGGVVSG